MIGMVKTNTKGFCQETIDNIAKKWSGGSYLVLRSRHTIPQGTPLISIGYKHYTQNVIYLITQAVITYLSKYSGHFLMLPFTLLLAPLSCISYLYLLIRLTTTTNQGSLIWQWGSYELLSVGVYGYVY